MKKKPPLDLFLTLFLTWFMGMTTIFYQLLGVNQSKHIMHSMENPDTNKTFDVMAALQRQNYVRFLKAWVWKICFHAFLDNQGYTVVTVKLYNIITSLFLLLFWFRWSFYFFSQCLFLRCSCLLFRNFHHRLCKGECSYSEEKSKHLTQRIFSNSLMYCNITLF